MDIPVGLVNWEVFVPERYKTSVTGGNALDAEAVNRQLAKALREEYASAASSSRVGVADSAPSPARVLSEAALAGGVSSELRGVARDSSGAVLPGVTVEATSPSLVDKVRSGVTDGQGQFRIVGLPPGEYHVDFTLLGFNMARLEAVRLTPSRATIVEAELRVGGVLETVTVTGASAEGHDFQRVVIPQPTVFPPSSNVVSLQRRTAGVLPIRVDVPKAGTSLQFVKPLVVDQEVVVKLRYKER